MPDLPQNVRDAWAAYHYEKHEQEYSRIDEVYQRWFANPGVDLRLEELLDLMAWVCEKADAWPDRDDTRIRPSFLWSGNEWVAQFVTEHYEEAPEDPGYFDRKQSGWQPGYSYVAYFDESDTDSPLEAVLLAIDAIIEEHPAVLEAPP